MLQFATYNLQSLGYSHHIYMIIVFRYCSVKKYSQQNETVPLPAKLVS